MKCTKCNQEFGPRDAYFRTMKDGLQHFICGGETLLHYSERLSSEFIEKLIEAYEHRGPSVTKFEAMTGVAAMMRGGK